MRRFAIETLCYRKVNMKSRARRVETTDHRYGKESWPRAMVGVGCDRSTGVKSENSEFAASLGRRLGTRTLSKSLSCYGFSRRLRVSRSRTGERV